MPTSTATPPDFTAQPILFTKTTIASIVVISVLATIALAIALWLLFHFTCSSKRRRVGLAVNDGRNEHVQWWKNANPLVNVGGEMDVKVGPLEEAPLVLLAGDRGRRRYHEGGRHLGV